MTIIAAADGSALGNPGPTGWGWYVDDSCWASGGWPHGTNNMGELMAVLDLLQQSAHLDDDLVVYCDSRYVIDAITKWMPGWKRNGWVKKDRKPVLNVELMKALDEAMQDRRHRVRFEWVKGHAGHELNEAADRLANAAALAFKEGREPESGPGFAGSTTSHPAAEVGQVVTEPDLFSDLEQSERVGDDEQLVDLERSLLDGIGSSQWPAGVVVTVSRPAPEQVLLVWRASADEGTTLRSSLWTRTRGGWQHLSHQGTREG